MVAEKLFVVFGTARRNDGRLALLPHLKATQALPPSFEVELRRPDHTCTQVIASCTDVARETWAQPIGCLVVNEVSVPSHIDEVPIGTEVWVVDEAD